MDGFTVTTFLGQAKAFCALTNQSDGHPIEFLKLCLETKAANIFLLTRWAGPTFPLDHPFVVLRMQHKRKYYLSFKVVREIWAACVYR